MPHLFFRALVLTALSLAGPLCVAHQTSVNPNVQMPMKNAPPEMLVGVNRVNMGFKPAAEQQELIDQMKANGVQYVRFTLRGPMAKSIGAIQLATRAELHVLATINLGDDHSFRLERLSRWTSKAKDGHGPYPRLT